MGIVMWRTPGTRAGSLEDVMARLEAPRFLVTSIAVDGTLEGPDFDLYRQVLALTDRPVLASGGVRGPSDLRGLVATGVEGVVVGTALYEGTLTLRDALEEAER